MEAESSFYKWDKKLTLSDENFDFNKDGYDENVAKDIPFPSDYTLAQFSQLAYTDGNYSLPDDWKLLTTATNTNQRNGYFGVAFWNPTHCQVVIAHRGTELSNPGALLSDAQLALKKPKTKQSQSAATFVHRISEQIKLKNLSDGPCLQLSITGHSLGAWLAQVTTFTVKYLKNNGERFVEDKEYTKNIHAHTVVFESPGCKETLASLRKTYVPRYSHRKFGNYDVLDMTVYLSKRNPINSINQHVGTIYYMVHAETHSISEFVQLFDRNTHKIERKIVLDFQTGMYASCKLLIMKLLPTSSTEKQFREAPADENEYSLNVFAEDELDFVKDWAQIIQHASPSIREFKHKNSLADFKVDPEYHTIRGNNINKSVACIKRLRPTKTIIYKMLENDVHDKLHSEVFKLEVQHFQKSLIKLDNCCFKDKYNIIEFLKSEDKILHIYVDDNSELEFELETSILNNVFTLYKNGKPSMVDDYFKDDQYCFLDWDKVYKLRHFLPKILGKGTDKVNLLVIQAFEESEPIKENILQCIHEVNAKIIIISTDQYTWREENNVKTVAGFGSNITFKDLTEDCQKNFMKQPNLILHGRKLSLNDIIDADFPLSEEIYDRLNKAIPLQALLQYMLTPLVEITMDCPYANLLSSVVFLDLYREIEVECLMRDYKDSLFIIQNKNEGGLSEQKKDILKTAKQIIKIQCDIHFEKECLQNFDKIMYLITVDNNKLFLTKIFNKRFYMHRNIFHKRTISQSIFNDTDIDQYYVIAKEQKFNEITSHLIKEQRERFKLVESGDISKKRMRNIGINTHLLKVQDEEILWLYSHGNMEAIRRHIEINESSVKESEIIKQEIVVLSGEPGMGKSSSISYLFLQLKRTHWVFAIPLKRSTFDDLRRGINFDSAADFIWNNCSVFDNSVIPHLLSYCLKNKAKIPIYLMFDGYDEIDKESKQIFIDLINFLKNSSSASTLITTRTYIRKELENAISVFASEYQALDLNTEVTNYFCNFHYSQLHVFEENVNTNDVKTLVPNILKNAKAIFGETISSFIGMPMQMRMLAEILTPLKSSAAVLMLLDDVVSLYRKYIEMRYNIYFQRIGLSNQETVKKWLSQHISEKLYKMAIAKAFNVHKESIDYNDVEDVQELNRLGLIQSNSSSTVYYTFLHDSLRDYFIAYLLKQWFESDTDIIYPKWNVEKFIVSDFLLRGEYKEMRFFVNSYLKRLEISSKRLEICQSTFQQLWKSEPNLFVSDNQESFLHTCASENVHYLIKHLLFKIVDSPLRTELLSKRNADFKTPLSLALDVVDKYQDKMENVLVALLEELNKWKFMDIKKVLLATLYTYHVFSTNLLDTLNDYSKKYTNVSKAIQDIQPHIEQINDFLNACMDNNLDEVNSILNQHQNDKNTRDYLLTTTTKQKQTCLHLTSSKEMVDRLLKLGVHKNLQIQDHHEMTPLTRAIKQGNTDIAILFIGKGASLVSDYYGNSPLYHAAKHNQLEIIKRLLSAKNPTKIDLLNGCNKFGRNPLMIAAKFGHVQVVKYLLDKNADVSNADCNGMTAFYHAVKGKGNYTELIGIFRKKGADVNTQDNNLVSPLLYSIQQKRWPMVNTLLDNGADINIGSGNEFPLKLLIKMKKKDIIKKVLENVVMTTKKGTISRAAANIDILSEEEIFYINSIKAPKR